MNSDKDSKPSLGACIAEVFSSRRDQLVGYQVLLFGSRARASHRFNSDYDIGVLGKKPIKLNTFFEIQDAIEALPTLYTIDWVDLNRATKNLRENARKEGKLLYEG